MNQLKKYGLSLLGILIFFIVFLLVLALPFVLKRIWLQQIESQFHVQISPTLSISPPLLLSPEYTVSGIEVEGKNFLLNIPELKFKLNWWQLFQGKLSLSALSTYIDRLYWHHFKIHRLHLQDGSFRYRGEGGDWWSFVEGEGKINLDEIQFEKFQARDLNLHIEKSNIFELSYLKDGKKNTTIKIEKRDKNKKIHLHFDQFSFADIWKPFQVNEMTIAPGIIDGDLILDFDKKILIGLHSHLSFQNLSLSSAQGEEWNLERAQVKIQTHDKFFDFFFLDIEHQKCLFSLRHESLHKFHSDFADYVISGIRTKKTFTCNDF